MGFHDALDAMDDVQFSELDGKVMDLHGVDYLTEEVRRYGDEYDNASVVAFRLNDRFYLAVEDPSDGYRSMLRCLKSRKATKADIKNKFGPIKVQASIRTGTDGRAADILWLQEVQTGELILEVGTDNTDDYYPSFVGNFDAAALTRAMKVVNPAAVARAKKAAAPIKGWGDW